MKKIPLIVKIILGIIITPIILLALLIGGIFGYLYYQDHFSTEAKLQKYIQTNDIEKLKKLKLSKGINGRYHDNTPLAYAVQANNAKAVKYFIELGADVNLEILCPPYTSCVLAHCSPLRYALFTENEEIIELLKSAGAKNDILTAVLTQDLPSVKEFIKNGEDLNKRYTMKEKSEKGVISYTLPTLLSIAKEKSSPEIVELLIANGAKE